MYALAAIGLLTIVLSALMIVSPSRWGQGILLFARWRYFHPFEVVSRLVLGGVLVAFANEAMHPRIMAGVGYVLLAVGVGLMLVGEKRHRAFANRSATFTWLFRPAGIVALAFGAFVMFSALGSSGSPA